MIVGWYVVCGVRCMGKVHDTRIPSKSNASGVIYSHIRASSYAEYWHLTRLRSFVFPRITVTKLTPELCDIYVDILNCTIRYTKCFAGALVVQSNYFPALL